MFHAFSTFGRRGIAALQASADEGSALFMLSIVRRPHHRPRLIFRRLLIAEEGLVQDLSMTG